MFYSMRLLAAVQGDSGSCFVGRDLNHLIQNRSTTRMGRLHAPR